MKNHITIYYYNDGSHGWGKVKKDLLSKLGIEKEITGCSYMRGEFVYLEEDCDLSKLIETLEKNNITYKAINCSGRGERRSKIRNYDSYRFLTKEETERYKLILAKVLAYANWSKKAVKEIKRGSLDSLEYWNVFYKINL